MFFEFNKITDTIDHIANFYQAERKEKGRIIIDKLLSHATPKNAAIGTVVTGAVAGAMINPVTRVALCGLISISYSMTMMSFQLIMLGLYIAMTGTSGFASVANYLKGCASDFSAGFNEVPQTQRQGPKPKEEMSSVKVEDVTEQSKQTSPAVQSKVSEKVLDEVWAQQKTSEPKEKPVQTTSSNSAPTSSNQISTDSTKVQPEYLDNDFEAVWEEQTTSQPIVEEPVSEEELYNQLVDEFEEEITGQTQQDSKLITPTDIDEFLQKTQSQQPGTTTNLSVEEFEEQIVGKDQRDEGLFKLEDTEKLIQQYSETTIAQLEQQNINKWANEFKLEQDVNEFLNQNTGDSNFVKQVAIGIGVSLVGYGVYKLYKAMNQESEEEKVMETKGNSYGNVSGDQLTVNSVELENQKAKEENLKNMLSSYDYGSD